MISTTRAAACWTKIWVGGRRCGLSSAPAGPCLRPDWREMWLARLNEPFLPRLAAASAPRRLLETRLGLRGFIGDQGRVLAGRLGRCLPGTVSSWWRVFAPVKGIVGPGCTNTRISRSGTADRLFAGSNTVVGPLVAWARKRGVEDDPDQPRLPDGRGAPRRRGMIIGPVSGLPIHRPRTGRCIWAPAARWAGAGRLRLRSPHPRRAVKRVISSARSGLARKCRGISAWMMRILHVLIKNWPKVPR